MEELNFDHLWEETSLKLFEVIKSPKDWLVGGDDPLISPEVTPSGSPQHEMDVCIIPTYVSYDAPTDTYLQHLLEDNNIKINHDLNDLFFDAIGPLDGVLQQQLQSCFATSRRRSEGTDTTTMTHICRSSREAQREQLMSRPVHDWKGSELDSDSDFSELSDEFMENYTNFSDTSSTNNRLAQQQPSTTTIPIVRVLGHDGSSRICQARKKPVKRVGRPRKNRSLGAKVGDAQVVPATMETDHDYCSQRPAPALDPVSMGASSTVSVLSAASTGHRSPSMRVLDTGKPRQLPKGGRKPKDGGAARNPEKREAHRVAEQNRRKIHKQLFENLVNAIMAVEPRAYADFNNKRSKKNNLDVALHLLNAQGAKLSSLSHKVLANLKDLYNEICEAATTNTVTPQRCTVKDVRQFQDEVNGMLPKVKAVRP